MAIKLLALSLLLGLSASPAAIATDFEGLVVAISDGDTVTVLRGNDQVKVRLWGIDAPERRQAFGTRAQQHLGNLVHGKRVRVMVRGADHYGRTLGVIMIGERNINLQMVRDGFAWWFSKYAPRDQELEHVETEARAARRGLWADPDSVPPWEWRKNR